MKFILVQEYSRVKTAATRYTVVNNPNAIRRTIHHQCIQWYPTRTLWLRMKLHAAKFNSRALTNVVRAGGVLGICIWSWRSFPVPWTYHLLYPVLTYMWHDHDLLCSVYSLIYDRVIVLRNLRRVYHQRNRNHWMFFGEKGQMFRDLGEILAVGCPRNRSHYVTWKNMKLIVPSLCHTQMIRSGGPWDSQIWSFVCYPPKPFMHFRGCRYLNKWSWGIMRRKWSRKGPRRGPFGAPLFALFSHYPRR